MEELCFLRLILSFRPGLCVPTEQIFQNLRQEYSRIQRRRQLEGAFNQTEAGSSSDAPSPSSSLNAPSSPPGEPHTLTVVNSLELQSSTNVGTTCFITTRPYDNLCIPYRQLSVYIGLAGFPGQLFLFTHTRSTNSKVHMSVQPCSCPPPPHRQHQLQMLRSAILRRLPKDTWPLLQPHLRP